MRPDEDTTSTTSREHEPPITAHNSYMNILLIHNFVSHVDITTTPLRSWKKLRHDRKTPRNPIRHLGNNPDLLLQTSCTKCHFHHLFSSTRTPTLLLVHKNPIASPVSCTFDEDPPSPAPTPPSPAVPLRNNVVVPQCCSTHSSVSCSPPML